jgi:predicted glycosyltransferase
MSRRLTLVAYAVNGSGLGHLTRLLAILRWVRRLARLTGLLPEIYILTSSEACALATAEGFAAFKIPSKTVIRDAGLPKDDYLRVARQWVWHSLGLIKPDLLLVDTFPGGTFGELACALDVPKVRVLVHRAMKETFAHQSAIQDLLPLYDRILVPEEPGCPKQALSPQVASRAYSLGPILLRDFEEMYPRAEARKRLGVAPEHLAVWVSAGGGGDPNAEKTLSTLVSTLLANEQIHVVIGAGPLYRGTPIRGARLTWITDFGAAADFSGLDFAISAAGYNSFHELLHAGVPTIFYAQEKIADEQLRRVTAAIAEGCALGLTIDDQGTPDLQKLQEVINQMLDVAVRERLGAAARAFVPRNWAREAAVEVLATMVSRSSLEDALELGTPSFFREMTRRGVEFELLQSVLGVIEGKDLDGSERRDLILHLTEALGSQQEVGLRLFVAWARRLQPVSDLEEAETLVETGIAVVKALFVFEDERGAQAVLRLLPAERRTAAKELAHELCHFLNQLAIRGESLWRGLAILSHHQGNVGLEKPLISVLAAASEELRHGQ